MSVEAWPKSEQEIVEELNAKSSIFLAEEKEIMYGCGLYHRIYELSTWILPRWIGDYLDGDDAHEDITPIIRESNGRLGIALTSGGYPLAHKQAYLLPLSGRCRGPAWYRRGGR